MRTPLLRSGILGGIVLLTMAPLNPTADAEESAPEGRAKAVKIPEIVAHRGASHDAPENTLPAFELAWEQGADAIEGDFFLTKDGKIICTHDKTTERLTEGKDNRIIAECTFDELRKLDVGSWKGEQWKDVRMPSLGEVLATIPDGKKLLIEIKCGSEIVPALKASVGDWNPDQLRIISFNDEVITECRKELPMIKAYWLTGYSEEPEGSGDWEPGLESVMATLRDTGASGLDSNAHDILNENIVKRLREANLEFHVWTVDDPVVAARFAALGVDSITTNRPAWLKAQMTQRSAETR